LNGDGIFQPGPAFEDIDWNGVRNKYPEPWTTYTYWDSTGQKASRTVFADFNNNNVLDTIEPLIGITQSDSADSVYELQSKAIAGTGRFDIDWNSNGVPDPATAVTIKRTVQTVKGVAENEIVYGQSDAWRIQVKIWAEGQGRITSSPEQFILPIAKDDAPYWRCKE